MSNEAVKALLSNTAEPAAMTRGGILADNFRRLLASRHVDEQRWDELLDKFVRQELQLVEHSDQSTYDALANNLTKELTAPAMSWDTYLNGLRFLGLTGASITVTGFVNGVAIQPVVSDFTWTGPQRPAEAPKDSAS